MAWAPSTNFEDDLVDLQPDLNFIHGQLAFEAANQNRSVEFTPRPKSTYDFIERRAKRNQQLAVEYGTRTKEISASLAMMERIQEIAGTKSLGEHATMADWDDRSTVEREVIAMMRHFGMASMADGSLEPRNDNLDVLPKTKFQIIRNGRESFPLILDPNYFEPGRTRKSSMTDISSSASSIYTDPYEPIESSESSASIYGSANSYFDDTNSNQDNDSYIEIPYQLLESSDAEPEMAKISKLKNTIYNRNNSSSQKQKQSKREQQ